jgi:uncharacterized delta-60 repeat protein
VTACRAAAGAIAATLALALEPAHGLASAGAVDPSFGSGGLAALPFGLGARAAAVALAPDGRIAVAGDRRGAGGEGALTARVLPSGALDGSFAGSGGRVDRFGTGATPQRNGAIAVQADGATIVAGVAGDQWSLARLLPTGLTDGLFGAAGVTLRDPSPGPGPREQYPWDEPALPDGTGPAAIALAPSGQIVVAGNVGVDNDDDVPGEQIVVARYGPTGLPDPAFGRDGFALLQLGFGSAVRHASSAARALSLLPDGRILIAGRSSARDGGDRAFVARLTASGRLDTGFARQGRLLVQLGRASAARRASSSLEALAQRPGGRLLAAGRATDVAGNHAVLLAGFTAVGALDTSFGRGGSAAGQLGRVTQARAPVSLARALVLQPDGAAIVAGAATGGALAARFASDGALDCGFGIRGASVAFGGRAFDPSTDGTAAAVLQPDGGLVVAGRRAGGGVLLGRLTGGPAGVAPLRTRLVTLGARYGGGGRGYAYGLIDNPCRSEVVRFRVTPRSGRSVLTRARFASGRYGPQVVCARLTGLRRGASYRVRFETTQRDGRRGAQRVLRATGPRRAALPQGGC